MNPKRFFIVFLLLTSLLLFALMMTVQASPSAQVQFPSPTPGADGRILYIVQPGDSCFRIQALYGITVDQLRGLNPQLDENCTLVVGNELMLGIGGPAALSSTPGPSPTLEPPTVTPTPPAGTTEICVLLYEDANGDALRQETELGIAGGAVSVGNTAGTFSETKATVSEIDPDTAEPVPTCFTDVPAGEYNISLAVPENYNPTMELSYSFSIKAGDLASVDFGAQSQTETGAEDAPENGGDGSSPSPVFGILGGLLLLGGLGLGWYAYQQRKPASRLKGGGFRR
ncbi:MAG: LysM domain-containing protein [Anaerolineales bacterium]